MERKFHGSESSLYGIFAPGNESAEERKGLESQKVQGHRAGFAVDVTPRSGGPVGRMLSIRWPCVTHSAQ